MESAVLIWTVGYQREARELQSAGNVITLSETATAEASTVARQEVISMSQTVRYCTFVPTDGADEAARSAADTRQVEQEAKKLQGLAFRLKRLADARATTWTNTLRGSQAERTDR